MPYTDSLRVASHEMLAEWQTAKFYDLLKLIHIKQSPAVLGSKPIQSYELRIWRRGIPKSIEQFIDASLQVFGENTNKKLHDFFLDLYPIRLNDNNQLIAVPRDINLGKEKRLTSKTIADLFLSPKICPTLSRAFANHFLTSIWGVLNVLPEGSRLALDDVPKHVYHDVEQTICNSHVDKFNNLLIHYTEPGTGYRFRNWHFDPVEVDFRSMAGDVTLHGTRTDHGNATAGFVNGRSKLRVCIAFQVHTPAS